MADWAWDFIRGDQYRYRDFEKGERIDSAYDVWVETGDWREYEHLYTEGS